MYYIAGKYNWTIFLGSHMATYTARQQQILEKLGKTMGFSLTELTDVSFQSDIPVNVTYQNERGKFSRQTFDQLGSILNNMEISSIKAKNAGNSFASSASFMSAKALFGKALTAKATDFASTIAKSSSATGLPNINSVFDPKVSRLQSSGLGAVTNNTPATTTSVTFTGQDGEDRVRISDPTGIFINAGNAVLKPLSDVGFVLFPYTPSISMTHSANYDVVNLTHSDYSYPFYQNSPTATISINATFTAKDPASAAYVLAVQHFFRSVTKMFYGKDAEAGTPPPVLRLDGHGEYQFSSVPVVVTDFSITLPPDVDYISTSTTSTVIDTSQTMQVGGGTTVPTGQTSSLTKVTRVPVIQDFNITLMPLYSRRSISRDFGLRDFAAGKLLGVKNGRGGFI